MISETLSPYGVIPSTSPEVFSVNTIWFRDVSLSTQEFSERGREFFHQTYGTTAGPVQSLLDSIYPDMGTDGPSRPFPPP